MFVQYLSDRQQAALLHYSYEVMRADKAVEAEESIHLEVLRSQVRPGIEAEDVPLGELADLFEDRLTRMALLFELVGMGFADDKYSEGETELISQLAAALGIGDKDLAAIVSWVKRQLALAEEARNLIEG